MNISDPQILLESFRAEDRLADAHPILQDSRLASLVHAWSKIPVTWLPPDHYPGISAQAARQWDVLWESCDWDQDDLALAAGLSETDTLLVFQRAKVLRLIYPDGSIADSARRVLGLEVGERIAGLVKTKGQPSGGQTPDKSGGIDA